jgi:hypothetical protein
MLVLRKSHLKRAALIMVLVIAAGALLVSTALAAANTTVTIVTVPRTVAEDVYIDRNGDGIRQSNEFMGTFPVFDGNEEMVFSWKPYAFATGTSGAYRVSLWQNTTPFAAQPTWQQLKVAHYWTSNSTSEVFTVGSFGFGETVCTTCPTMFVAQPEIVEKYYDPMTNIYEYKYTLISGAGTASQPWAVSPLFLISIVRTQACAVDLANSACEAYCRKNGTPTDDCKHFCKAQILPYSKFNWDTCTCTTNDAECTADGGTFLKEVCVCQKP